MYRSATQLGEPVALQLGSLAHGVHVGVYTYIAAIDARSRASRRSHASSVNINHTWICAYTAVLLAIVLNARSLARPDDLPSTRAAG